MSDCGVFCVFFTNPCSRTIEESAMQKSTLAIRPLLILLLTSQSPRPRDRTRGIPIGHENSASLMSSDVFPDGFPVGGRKPQKPFPHRFLAIFIAIELRRQPLHVHPREMYHNRYDRTLPLISRKASTTKWPLRLAEATFVFGLLCSPFMLRGAAGWLAGIGCVSRQCLEVRGRVRSVVPEGMLARR